MALFRIDEPDEDQFTGALMIADWYIRRVQRDKAEAEAGKKSSAGKKYRGRR